jgi:hypothetical protein
MNNLKSPKGQVNRQPADEIRAAASLARRRCLMLFMQGEAFDYRGAGLVQPDDVRAALAAAGCQKMVGE